MPLPQRRQQARRARAFFLLLRSEHSSWYASYRKVKLMEVPAGGGQTILVVEDDELVRPSVESLIESLGYQVLSARNGPDALEILRQDTPIDLLFTDVFMPGGMYGPKLVAEARRLRPQLKILYIYIYIYIGLRGLHAGPWI